MKNIGYRIDYTNNTVTVTKKFLAEAGILGSSAFNAMKELRQMGMVIVTKEASIRKSNRITFAQMIQYISIVENSEVYMEQFNAMREEAKSKNDSYNRVLNWFRQTFPRFYEMPEFNDKNEVIVKPSDYLTEISPAA